VNTLNVRLKETEVKNVLCINFINYIRPGLRVVACNWSALSKVLLKLEILNFAIQFEIFIYNTQLYSTYVKKSRSLSIP